MSDKKDREKQNLKDNGKATKGKKKMTIKMIAKAAVL
jgi:hypothetical protein